jgi:hydrogenase/urease accessory protein HupE
LSRRGAAALVAVVALALVLAGTRRAEAHGMRTAYFELVESRAGAGVATLRFTLVDPTVRFTVDGCTLAPTSGGDASANRFAFVFHCPSSLAGRAVHAVGLGPIVSEAVVRVALAGGGVRSGVLRADAPSLRLPAEARAGIGVAGEYVRLGVVHIATGLDHLLFLLALALQLWRVRAVLLAETAFTLSHTLSFSATALGLLRLSPAAAEACIALSLVLLARELAAGRRVTPGRGAVVALGFGLVHGLGFAGGLREVGLPEHDVGLALAGFAGGVELGQVLFLALVLGLLHVGRVARRRASLEQLGGLAIGSVGAWWLCQRLVVLLRCAT